MKVSKASLRKTAVALGAAIGLAALSATGLAETSTPMPAPGPGMMTGSGAGMMAAPGAGYGPGGMRRYGTPGPGEEPPRSYGMGPGMMYGYGPGYGRGPGWMGGNGPGFGMGPRAMFGGYYGNTDEGLAAMKAQLGITAKQDAAWQAFAKNAKKQSENRQAWFAKMQKARSAGSAPEVLAQQAEIMKQREAELETNSAALKNLYAALTPEQKATADQLFGGNCPGYGPGYGRGYRGGPGGRFR